MIRTYSQVCEQCGERFKTTVSADLLCVACVEDQTPCEVSYGLYEDIEDAEKADSKEVP